MQSQEGESLYPPILAEKGRKDYSEYSEYSEYSIPETETAKSFRCVVLVELSARPLYLQGRD